MQVTLWFSLREVGLNSEILVPWLDIKLWIIQPIDSRKWWYHCVQIVGEKQVSFGYYSWDTFVSRTK